MSEAEQSFGITLEQVSDYEFRVRFDGTAIPDLITDETSPLGGDAGPNPTHLIATAVANCLAASLLFALRKYKNSPGKIGAKAKLSMARNEHGRLRVTHIGVDLQLADKAEVLAHLDRAGPVRGFLHRHAERAPGHQGGCERARRGREAAPAAGDSLTEACCGAVTRLWQTSPFPLPRLIAPCHSCAELPLPLSSASP